MRKTFVATMLLLTFAIVAATNLYANDEVAVTINGEAVEFDVPPQIIDGRTMVPMRAIFEALGATVDWDDEAQTVIATTADYSQIHMQIGNTTIFVGGSLRAMDVAPQLVGGRTMIPARFVAEAMGMEVSWDNETGTVVITSPPTRVISVATGRNSSYAVTNDGTLWDVARGYYIITGDGRLVWITEHRTPNNVMNNVTAVSVGENHAVAIRTDGSLWAWGGNFVGQLGDGSGDDGTSIPPELAVKVMDNVAMVSAGRHHTMALQTDGSLWAWGWNQFGQLGDGTAIDRCSPVRIMENVTYVSAGSNHTVAIKADNSLWAWGDNWFGQIGGGQYGIAQRGANEVIPHNQPSPIRVMENIVHAAASTGASFTLAVTAHGDLLFWGAYSFIGDQNTHYIDSALSPMQIMSNVAYVFADGDDKMVIQRDGSLWAWYLDVQGRIDVDLDAKNRTFIRVMDNAAAVASGFGNTMVIMTDGTMVAWGHHFGDMPSQILLDAISVN